MGGATAPTIRTHRHDKVLTILLAGGRGERLHPLTRDRAKPAVPFGGTYRIIDFPLSNCLNSGLRKILVLTQYHGRSIERHIRLGWNVFLPETGDFIEPIAPQATTTETFYLGTADAVFQNLALLEETRPDRVLLLPADHVYRMNYGPLLDYHADCRADVTLACCKVPRAEASRFGVVSVDSSDRILRFTEKPANPEPIPGDPEHALVSMGIYVFDTEKLVLAVTEDARTEGRHDFGSDVLPRLVGRGAKVFAYRFDNPGDPERDPYWRDIGTIEAYYDANLDLTTPAPAVMLSDSHWPIRTFQMQLPPARILCGQGTSVLDSIVSSGCVLHGCHVERCVLSPEVQVSPGAEVTQSIILGRARIGWGARVRRAIIDEDATIPDGMSIGFDMNEDRRRLVVTDNGITVVPRRFPA